MPAPPACPAPAPSPATFHILADTTRPLTTSPGKDAGAGPSLPPSLSLGPARLQFTSCPQLSGPLLPTPTLEVIFAGSKVPRGWAVPKQSSSPRTTKQNLLRANQSPSSISEVGEEEGLENQAQNLLWRSRTTARLKQLQLSGEPWASSKRRGGGRGGEARGLADLGTLTCTPAQAASSGALHAALSRPKRWALLPGALAPSSPISPSPAWEAPGPQLPSLAAETRTEGVAKNCCSALFRGAGQRPPSHMGPLEGGAQPGLACAPPPTSPLVTSTGAKCPTPAHAQL